MQSQAHYTVVDLDYLTMKATTIPERIELAKKHINASSDADFGKKCGMSKSVVNQLKTGRMQSIASRYAYKLEDEYGINARWFQLGVGNMLELKTPNQVKQSIEKYNTRDPILDDLDALPPEDADVWRAQIRAAAIKARQLKQEKRDRELAAKALDPPIDVKRTA